MKFSIIIPVYNVEKYLKKCLTSIVQQNFNDYELILVDDGSTDMSGKICDEFEEKYNNIIVMHISNSGVSNARNKGLEIARGEYIWFVDSDDYVEPEALKILSEQLEMNPKIELLFFETNVWKAEKDQKEKIVFDKIRANEIISTDIKEFLNVNTSLWNKVYRRDILLEKHVKFELNISIAEDLLFNYMYLLECKYVFYLNKILYNYVIRQNSAMQGAGRDADVQKAFEKLIDYYKKKGVYYKYRKELEYLVYYHVYMVQIVREIRNNVDTTRIDNLKKWIKKQKMGPIICNKYIRKLSLKHIILLGLIMTGQYSVIKILFESQRSN